MNKNLKFLFVFALVAAMFSSCKKSPSDTTILTSHKWVLSTSIATYSDSAGITHNLIQPDTICQSSSYTELHDRTPNNELRLAYTYTTTNCPLYHTPEISISSWDIDADNADLYLYGNTTDGSGGKWYVLSNLSSSGMTLTQTQQELIGNTGYPHYTPIYHVVTYTETFTTK